VVQTESSSSAEAALPLPVQNDDTLSRNTIIATVVVACVAGLIIIGFIIYVCFRNNKRKLPKLDTLGEDDNTEMILSVF
jgi:hypothetical protein